MATPTRDYIPVAKGGIWSTARPPISQETQNLLKGKHKNESNIKLMLQ